MVIAMLKVRIECFKTVVLLFVVSHCCMGAKYGIRVASDTAFQSRKPTSEDQ